MNRRSGFTLFELILAIALSVTLVALIGTAINLYLARVDGSRTQVEEAQLARSILAMIADDIRATTIYQTQDTSALAAMASSGAFDVDSVDDQRSGGRGGEGGGGGSGGSGGSGGGGGGAGGNVDDIDAPSATSSVSASGSGGGGGSGFGGGSSGTSSGSGMSGAGSQGQEPPTTLPLGLNGSLDELYVDSTRIPRREELFSTVTGYTNAPIGVETGNAMATSTATAPISGIPRPADLKTVRYFVRPGEPVAAGSVAATSLDPEAQLRAGGLVRQQVPRAMRVWAEQSGNSMVLDSGQALIAPEVVQIQFRYFDGAQVTDVWDMRERGSLPVAIEVRLWILPTGTDAAAMMMPSNLTNVASTAREYRQTVFLPMSQVANSAASMSGGAGGSGTSSGLGTATSGGSSSSSSSTGTGF